MAKDLARQQEAAVATVVIDRADWLNAMTTELLEVALSALEAAAAEEPIQLANSTGTRMSSCVRGILAAEFESINESPSPTSRVGRLRRFSPRMMDERQRRLLPGAGTRVLGRGGPALRSAHDRDIAKHVRMGEHEAECWPLPPPRRLRLAGGTGKPVREKIQASSGVGLAHESARLGDLEPPLAGRSSRLMLADLLSNQEAADHARL